MGVDLSLLGWGDVADVLLVRGSSLGVRGVARIRHGVLLLLGQAELALGQRVPHVLSEDAHDSVASGLRAGWAHRLTLGKALAEAGLALLVVGCGLALLFAEKLLRLG